MKRFAKLLLIAVVLVVAVQPRLALHFCGDKFISLYVNHDPALIKSACHTESQSHTNSDPSHHAVEADHTCPNRLVIALDVDVSHITDAPLHRAPSSLLSNVLLPPQIELFHFAEPMAHLIYDPSHPEHQYPLSGREILTNHCTYII